MWVLVVTFFGNYLLILEGIENIHLNVANFH
jgi:hypothetical protein